jgi:hypothetical protein
MSARRLVALASLLAAVLIIAVQSVAQAPTPAAQEPELLLVTFTKVRPGMGPKYVDLQVKEVMPAQMKGGSPGRQVFSSGVAGPPGEYVFVTPISSMARFDEPPPMTKALGEEGAAALNAKLAELAEPMGSAVVRVRADMSYIPDPKAPPAPLSMITVVDVVPGKRTAFEAFIKKDVVPVMERAKVHSYRVMEVVYGEHTGGYVTAIGFDSYASIGKGHPFQVILGEEGARKLEANAGGLVTKIHRFISRHRPELSWSPKAGS